MKAFFKLLFGTFNNLAKAAYSISEELPVLVKMLIQEIKDLFKEETPTLTKK